MVNGATASGADDAAIADAARVYVGNLKPKANETHLTQAFARFGVIESVWVARKPPGFAFVAFARGIDAIRAVETYGDNHPLEILGKRVKVQLAGEKTAKESVENPSKSATQSGRAKREKPKQKESVDGKRRSRERRGSSRSRSRSVERSRRKRRAYNSPQRRWRSRSSSSRSASPPRRRRMDSESQRRRRSSWGSRGDSPSKRRRRARSRSASRSRSRARSKSPSHWRRHRS